MDAGPLSNLGNARSVRMSSSFTSEKSEVGATGRKPGSASGSGSSTGGVAGGSEDRVTGGIRFGRGPDGLDSDLASGTGKIAGLCPEDKQKIATLIQQVVKVRG